MSKKGGRFEWYPWCNYVKCPNCGEEHKIVERATNLKSYVIYCPTQGRIELSENEEMKAKREYYEGKKAKLAPILASTPLPRKRKTRSQEKRKKEKEGKTQAPDKLKPQKMMDYVKGSEIDNWHWCKNCTQYPMYVYVRRSHSPRPRSGLCSQCKAKEDNKDCITQ